MNTESTNNTIIAVTADEGPSISMVGDTYRIIVKGEQTNGAYALIDMLIPPGGGPPPHLHVTFQESFYILDGQIAVITKEKKYIATKGSYVNIPFNGPVHKFTNKTDKIAHILCLLTPAGMEKMFEEIGKPVAASTFLPPSQMTPEELKQIQSIAEKYGHKLYSLDYLD
ncbi:MAG TPA: cupin domain-containing protein [Bacillus sp. (in: firmicutes)]|jgi:quercetin dioxygenase-like cupin family protein|nr:cupin domain-containing protein [Bacillus sp. (in: firmicutes)]